MKTACVCLLTLFALAGCVERKITVGSDPEGALLQLNDVEVGRTPVTVPFTWYGDYDVRLHYERNVGTAENPQIRRYYLHTSKQTVVPWYQIMGVDLFAEILPIKFVDEQVWAFPIPEVAEPTTQALIERAHALRTEMEKPEELKGKGK